jgi:group I intron endonuclease
MIGVYLIANKVNGKTYVGSSRRAIEGRWSSHRYYLRRGGHTNPHLQAAWDLYGEDAFVFTCFEETTPEGAIAAERDVIRMLKTEDPYGYNLATPGEAPMLGRKHTALGKLHMRVSADHHKRPDVAARNKELKSCKGKLTWEIVNEIRASSQDTHELAIRFGITHQYVSKIRLNQRWKSQSIQKVK